MTTALDYLESALVSLGKVRQLKDIYVNATSAESEVAAAIELIKIEQASKKPWPQGFVGVAPTSRHRHVNANDGTDNCLKCGNDLRSEVHERIAGNG